MVMKVKKKRGRPSKISTSNEQINGISKPQVQLSPVVNHQVQEDTNEPTKRKRGRPSGASPKKAVVVAAPSVSKEVSPTKKRGRPSGSARAKKAPPKPKATANADGPAKKRGRPKKSLETPVATTPTTEPATVPSDNVQ